MYKTLALVLIAISGLMILFIRARRKHRQTQSTVESYVSIVFAQQSYHPEVSAGFTYGIPSVSLKFKTDKEKQHAIDNGLTEQFIAKIQELYAHLHPRGEAFQANRAVRIYSIDDEERWRAQAATHRNKKS